MKTSLLLLVAFAVTGCSSFSKNARQQRAYEKYIRKSSVQRERQRTLMKPMRVPPNPSADSPESVTTTDE